MTTSTWRNASRVSRAAIPLLLACMALSTRAEAQNVDGPVHLVARLAGEHHSMSWESAVDILQHDSHPAGRTIEVQVLDAHNVALPCNWYSLSLDEHGMRAFVIGHCDPHRGTAIRLAHGSELFDSTGPRRIGVTVIVHPPQPPPPQPTVVVVGPVSQNPCGGTSTSSNNDAITEADEQGPGCLVEVRSDQYHPPSHTLRVEPPMGASIEGDHWLVMIPGPAASSASLAYTIMSRSGSEVANVKTILPCRGSGSGTADANTALPPPLTLEPIGSSGSNTATSTISSSSQPSAQRGNVMDHTVSRAGFWITDVSVLAGGIGLGGLALTKSWDQNAIFVIVGAGVPLFAGVLMMIFGRNSAYIGTSRRARPSAVQLAGGGIAPNATGDGWTIGVALAF